MDEITAAVLEKAMRSGAEQAIKLNKALGLSYLTVKNDLLVSIAPDGAETILGKPMFGNVKIEKRKYSLKSEK
jgi:hypothetical protein